MMLQEEFTLDYIEEQLARQYPVKQISSEELRRDLSGGDSSGTLLFDTRSSEEYSTSHLRGAIQVDPEITPQDFLQQFGERISGKKLIFYCSVGKRSSKVIQRLQSVLQQKEAASAANLRGGIFRWYNQGYSVYNSGGETDQIHPYDQFWGRLVHKRSQAD